MKHLKLGTIGVLFSVCIDVNTVDNTICTADADCPSGYVCVAARGTACFLPCP